MRHDTRAVQARLAALGFDPGPIDGVRGRRTIVAIKAFQAAHGLTLDGLAGPLTFAALLEAGGGASAPSPDAHPWLDIAQAKMGLHEKANRLALAAFLRSDGRTLGDPAKLPWCGDFVETCLALSLPGEPLPANPYLARNWLRFGRASSPGRGAVLVFWRGARTGQGGHVGFYHAEDARAFHVLGGNQANRVSICRISKSRLLGARWPVTALAGGGARMFARGEGALSSNEA
ncbi:MAG: TIGR02594 family protein [Flavobacteriaceae bacterium]